MARPRIFVRASPRGTVVEIEERLYLRLDAAGRWLAYGEGGALFRRTVDARVLRPRGRAFEALAPAEAEAVHGWVGRRAGELLEVLAGAKGDELHVLGSLDEARTNLAEATCWTRAPLGEARRRYGQAYPEPVPILPPHRYRDLVILPATGCPNARCTYCAFYRDRPFHVLDDDAFAAHVDAVRRLFGASLAERDGLFLGSASALTLRDEALLTRLAHLERVFGRPRRGVASFHDPDRGVERDARAWAALADAGLVESALGLETGEPGLRAAVGKSDDLERFARTVAAQKHAGLAVSITVLVGLGGEERADLHRERTVAFLARLPLERNDRVYLSPLADALPPARADEETAHWRTAVSSRTDARVGDYRIERFAYFA